MSDRQKTKPFRNLTPTAISTTYTEDLFPAGNMHLNISIIQMRNFTRHYTRINSLKRLAHYYHFRWNCIPLIAVKHTVVVPTRNRTGLDVCVVICTGCAIEDGLRFFIHLPA